MTVLRTLFNELTRNRKFWQSSLFALLLVLVSTSALAAGLIKAGHWLHVVDSTLILIGGHLVVNAGQKIGLAKVGAEPPQEPKP